MRAALAEGEAALRYPIRGIFVRLLRLGWKAKSQKDGAQSKDKGSFTHRVSPHSKVQNRKF